MKWALYNFLFACVFPFLLPGFLIRMLRRGGYRAYMGERFGLYDRKVHATLKKPGSPFVWIHAVSVGEVQVAGQLMRAWREVEPSVRFCLSVTSSTGHTVALKEVTENDLLIYNPLDFPNFVKSALSLIQPRALILTESEIWPIFIRRAAKMEIPVFLINARVSDRSAPRYAKGKFFFKDVFQCFKRIFSQSEIDTARLIAGGAQPAQIETTGSFKFDVARRNEAKERELADWIGAGRILLGGSTWPGEERILLRAFERIRAASVEAKGAQKPVLVLAPRHFEKADAVEVAIREFGFSCVRRSRGEKSTGAANEVFLADTTGELMGLYGLAEVVFVGKSMCAHGSQNMIEPCLCGKPTVVGPYTENFRPVMSDLLEAQAIIQEKDEKGVEETLVNLFLKGNQALGQRAAEAVCRRRGVVPRCVETIRSVLA